MAWNTLCAQKTSNNISSSLQQIEYSKRFQNHIKNQTNLVTWQQFFVPVAAYFELSIVQSPALCSKHSIT